VTTRDIERFSEMTGDRNPLHYDAPRPSAPGLGKSSYRGVTTGILNAVVAEDLPGPGSVFLEAHWRFLAPVRPGDEIVGCVDVTEVRDDKPITHLETVVTRGDGTVVLSGTAVCYTSSLD
jgi:acyl dehydratase